MMIHLPTTSFYAGFLTLAYLGLAFRIISIRRREGIGMGDGGKALLARRIRGHGNFAEYVPLTLLLLALCELQGAGLWVLHGIGAILCLGRGLHAFAFAQDQRRLLPRTVGMSLTFLAMIAAAVVLFGFSF